MSHCINFIVSKLPFDGALKHEDAYIAPTKIILKENLPEKYAICKTDYFGGFGEQSADLYVNANDCVCTVDCINDVLETLGFKNMNPEKYRDLFEWVGLHKYRSNEEFPNYQNSNTDTPFYNE